MHGKLGIKQIANWISYPLYKPHQEKCHSPQDTAEQDDSHDAKIIEGIVKKSHCSQFFFGYISR